jgi:hypothetical protein
MGNAPWRRLTEDAGPSASRPGEGWMLDVLENPSCCLRQPPDRDRPDGRVHVSERLLMLHDGPLLEQSLKAIAGTTMRLPRRREHHPDRDRLATRFEQFKRVA